METVLLIQLTKSQLTGLIERIKIGDITNEELLEILKEHLRISNMIWENFYRENQSLNRKINDRTT